MVEERRDRVGVGEGEAAKSFVDEEVEASMQLS